MTDLDKAREWADMIQSASDNGHPIDKGCYAAAELIQSLPDQWVDVEKVREVVNSQLSNYVQGTVGHSDSEVTLIHKLVPETHTLPEGMRLADHKEYGRVVVAPRSDTHGEEYFYRLREDSAWGASHGYRRTEEFTFLDGEA